VVDDPEQKEQMNSIFDAGRTAVFALFHRKKISFPNAISFLIFRTYQW